MKLGNRSGFTLLEVVIAMTIMVLALASILTVESNSLNATTRARQMNTVAMLAKNQMVEFELQVEGKAFEEVRKEETGVFPAPHEAYRWRKTVRELEFPNLAAVGKGSTGSSSSSASNGSGGTQDIAERIARLITNYFNKAIREITVTIFWTRGSGEVSYSVSTYWVNLNQEFKTSE